MERSDPFLRKIITKPASEKNDSITMTDKLISQNTSLFQGSCRTFGDESNPSRERLILTTQRSTGTRKKQDALMCSVCEGPAHGYNFNAITCESCKAFFRRNALKSQDKLKCRFENGQCVVNMTTRKRCKSCRLTKCFEKGMRADWILTDEERLNKRMKIEENKRLRQLLYPDLSGDRSDQDEPVHIKEELIDRSNVFQGHDPPDSSQTSSTNARKQHTTVSNSPPRYLKKVHEIQQAYADSVRLTTLPADLPSYPSSARLNSTSDMVNLPANIQTTRLITFYKLIPEFSSLRENDKLILIKYNAFTLTFIRAAINYDPLTDTYHEPNTEEPVFEGRDLIKCFSLQHYERSTRCVKNLLDASVNDRVLLQILLVVMLFSKGAAICTYIDEAEPIAEDNLSIYRAQNIFTELLWQYCETRFGVQRTYDIFLRCTLSLMDAHLQAFEIRRSCVKVDDVPDQLAPLMKSVMLIV